MQQRFRLSVLLHPDVGLRIHMIAVENCLDRTELIRREFDLERAPIRLHFGWRSGAYKRDAEHGVRQHPCQGEVIKLDAHVAGNAFDEFLSA